MIDLKQYLILGWLEFAIEIMIDKGQMADVDKYSRAIIEYKSALNSEQADGFVDRSNNHKLKI